MTETPKPWFCKLLIFILAVITIFIFSKNQVFDLSDYFTLIPQVFCLGIYFYFLYLSIDLIFSELKSDEKEHGIIPVQAIVYILTSAFFILSIIYKFKNIVEANREIFGLKVLGAGDENFYMFCYKLSFTSVLLAFIANFCKSFHTINLLEFGYFAGEKHSKNLKGEKMHVVWDTILRLITAILFILIEHKFSSFKVSSGLEKKQDYFNFISELKVEAVGLYLSILVWLAYVYFALKRKTKETNGSWWAFTFAQIIAGLGISGSLFVFGDLQTEPNTVVFLALLNFICAVVLIIVLGVLEFVKPVKIKVKLAA